ncbi:MAG: S-layer homology domain-containing protein [Bacillota bacterium]
MGKLYANRTLLGNIALVVFLAFLATLTLGSFTPAGGQAPQTRDITVLDKNNLPQAAGATLQTNEAQTSVTLTIRITPLTPADFGNIWFVIRDGERVLETVYASGVHSTVYEAGYQFVYAWTYSFTNLLPLGVSLVVYESGKEPKSIALTIEAPPPQPAPGPGPPPPAPVKHEAATGTVEVREGMGTLTVDAVKVERMLADPAVREVNFSIPVAVATQGTVAVPADLLARVLVADRPAVVDIGGAKLAIPPGALDLGAFLGQNVTLHLGVTKDESPAPSPAAHRLAGEVYRFNIEAFADRERKGAIRNFDRPVTLTVPYDPAKLAGAREADLGLFRYGEIAGRWEALPGSTVDRQNRTVSAPRSSLSLYAAMVRVFTPPQFTDIGGHWAEHDINLMAAKGIAGGMTATTFAPNQNVTRAQFAALLIRTLGITEQAAKGGRFTDVAAQAWYAGAVETAAAAGLVGGYPDGGFAPNANITRQELAAMVTRGLAHQGKDVKLDAAEVEAILARFGDQARISPWARTAAAVAADQDIVRGRADNAFAPRENATRAEAIVMLKRMSADAGSP